MLRMMPPAIALLLVPALAQAEEVPATATPEASKPNPVLVCRKEAPTGTRFAKKTCRRKVDIEARSNKDHDAVQDMNGPQINPPSSGG